MYLFLRHLTSALVVLISIISCEKRAPNYVPVHKEDFEIQHEGKNIELYSLKNSHGMTVKITNYGGKVVSILVPGREGRLGDISLGYETASGYLNGIASLGATMGRYANRIANARFTLDDSVYHLDKNDGVNSIHGGFEGFRYQVWNVQKVDGHTLKMSYISDDGEGGYPGNLKVEVIYSVTEENEFKLQYEAQTDKPTVINLTNHTFFNLAGEGHGDILDHKLYVNAKQFTPVDSEAIPIGKLRDVSGTPFDFTTATRIGVRIEEDNKQLKLVGGYDHNFVLDKQKDELALAARLSEPTSGRVMEVYTTEPGLQVYTTNGLTGEGNQVGKGGHPYGPRSAVCLETQHFPDTPHHDNFPTTVLTPDENYHSTTIYKFSTSD